MINSKTKLVLIIQTIIILFLAYLLLIKKTRQQREETPGIIAHKLNFPEIKNATIVQLQREKQVNPPPPISIDRQDQTGLFSTFMKTQAVYDVDSYFGEEFEKSYLPSGIPPILHIQWKSNMVPNFANETLARWRNLHPTWVFMLWTDAKMEEFAKEILDSEMLNIYRSLHKNIQRVDMMRYVILYHFGGVHADLDVLPERSVEPLRKHSCIIAREPEPYLPSTGQNRAILASIHFMMCRPWHPLFKEVLQDIKTSKEQSIPGKTGVYMMTRVLDKYSQQKTVEFQNSVFLAPSLYFYPPTHPKGDFIHLNMLKSACPKTVTSVKSFKEKICRVYRNEQKIDWSDMYLHERYHNDSFAKHLQFNSWSIQKESTIRVKNYVDLKSILPNYVEYESISKNRHSKVNISAFEREKLLLEKYKK